MICQFDMLLLSVLAAVAVLGASADTSTTTDLLWPLPASVEFGTNVYTLVPDSFAFTSTGPGKDSDILAAAFKRYSSLLFETPAPFYPAGAVTTSSPVQLPGLEVSVQSADESLGISTDESCEEKQINIYIYIHLVSVVNVLFFHYFV